MRSTPLRPRVVAPVVPSARCRGRLAESRTRSPRSSQRPNRHTQALALRGWRAPRVRSAAPRAHAPAAKTVHPRNASHQKSHDDENLVTSSPVDRRYQTPRRAPAAHRARAARATRVALCSARELASAAVPVEKIAGARAERVWPPSPATADVYLKWCGNMSGESFSLHSFKRNTWRKRSRGERGRTRGERGEITGRTPRENTVATRKGREESEVDESEPTARAAPPARRGTHAARSPSAPPKPFRRRGGARARCVTATSSRARAASAGGRSSGGGARTAQIMRPVR